MIEPMFDTVASVSHAVERAAGADRTGWSATARSAVVLDLLAARERLDALILAVVGEWDAEQAWAIDGAVSPVAWLAHRAALTRQDASVLVRSARLVARHAKTAKALDAGDITSVHVQVAARAATHREEHVPDHEDVILDAARTLAPSGFRVAMRHWRAGADAVADHHDAIDQVAGNYLDVAATFEGVGHLDGRLDPVSTVALIQALDRLEPPDPLDGVHPPRTLAQRRAAALMRLACGQQPPRVAIDVTVDVDTLAGRPAPDLRTGCGELRGLGPVSPAVVQTLACDAAIGRVLLRGESEVLDLGRHTRLVTPALRRALDLRDHGCVEPGCTAPAAWCDAHHIIHWTHHGETTLENLQLRCRRHHLRQHQRDLEALPRRRE